MLAFKLALASAKKGIPRIGHSWLSAGDILSLLSAFAIVPPQFAACEAKAGAEQWLNTRAGASALHAEEARLLRKEAESGATAASLLVASGSVPGGAARPDISDKARARLLETKSAELAQSILTDPSASAELFALYVRDARTGRWPPASPLPSANLPEGFCAWLQWRETRRRDSAHSYDAWRRAKDLEAAAERAAAVEVAPLNVVRALVLDAADRTTASRSGATTSRGVGGDRSSVEHPWPGFEHRRPSRDGLELPARLNRLAASSTTPTIEVQGSRRASVVSLAASVASVTRSVGAQELAATVRPGPRLVTREAVERELGPALASLRAAPGSSVRIRAQFNSRKAARSRVVTQLRSPGESGRALRARLASLEALVRDEVCEERATTDDEEEDVHAVAVELLIEEQAKEIVASGPDAVDPFTADQHAAALAALRAEEERRSEAESAFLAWTKRKEQAASLLRAAEAADATAKARAQALKSKEAEEAYSKWLRSARGRDVKARDFDGTWSNNGDCESLTRSPSSPSSTAKRLAQRSPLALTSVAHVLGLQLDAARAGLHRQGADEATSTHYEKSEQSIEQRRSALSSRFRETVEPGPDSPSRFEAAAAAAFEAQLRALEALQGAEGLGAVDEAEQALKRLAES